MRIDRLQLGKFKVWGLRDGDFYLDGGAMFGVVPKTLWEKKCPADAANRIRLSLNSILIKTPRALILVETGIGTKTDQKFSSIYCIQEAAVNPNEREKSSYLAENFLPLRDYGLLELVDGDTTIAEGIEVVLAPGHTARHQSVKVQSQGKTLFYCGDMVPTASHIGLSYIMSYDLYPLDTLESRKKFYEQAIREDWILAFVHDPEHYFGKVKKTGKKYEFEPL
jgi:hypothetical protein